MKNRKKTRMKRNMAALIPHLFIDHEVGVFCLLFR